MVLLDGSGRMRKKMKIEFNFVELIKLLNKVNFMLIIWNSKNKEKRKRKSNSVSLNMWTSNG